MATSMKSPLRIADQIMLGAIALSPIPLQIMRFDW